MRAQPLTGRPAVSRSYRSTPGSVTRRRQEDPDSGRGRASRNPGLPNNGRRSDTKPRPSRVPGRTAPVPPQGSPAPPAGRRRTAPGQGGCRRSHLAAKGQGRPARHPRLRAEADGGTAPDRAGSWGPPAPDSRARAPARTAVGGPLQSVPGRQGGPALGCGGTRCRSNPTPPRASRPARGPDNDTRPPAPPRATPRRDGREAGEADDPAHRAPLSAAGYPPFRRQDTGTPFPGRRPARTPHGERERLVPASEASGGRDGDRGGFPLDEAMRTR